MKSLRTEHPISQMIVLVPEFLNMTSNSRLDFWVAAAWLKLGRIRAIVHDFKVYLKPKWLPRISKVYGAHCLQSCVPTTFEQTGQHLHDSQDKTLKEERFSSYKVLQLLPCGNHNATEKHPRKAQMKIQTGIKDLGIKHIYGKIRTALPNQIWTMDIFWTDVVLCGAIKGAIWF